VSSRQTLAKDCLLLEHSRECEITTGRDAGAKQLGSCHETTAVTPLASFKRCLSDSSPLRLIPALRLARGPVFVDKLLLGADHCILRRLCDAEPDDRLRLYLNFGARCRVAS
jgi:hypothetical protein